MKNITYKKMIEDINTLGTAFYNIGLKGTKELLLLEKIDMNGY